SSASVTPAGNQQCVGQRSPSSTTTSCTGPPRQLSPTRCPPAPLVTPKGTSDMRITTTVPAVAAVATLTLVGCSSSSESGNNDEWPDEITISLVPSIEGEDLAEALDPLTTYLSDGLGITVDGVVANDYAATVEALGANQAQVIITDAGSLYNAMEQFDAELILRDVRFGATSYAAVALTNNPDKYCDDEVVTATYEASGDEFTYCNDIE